MTFTKQDLMTIKLSLKKNIDETVDKLSAQNKISKDIRSMLLGNLMNQRMTLHVVEAYLSDLEREEAKKE